MFQAAFPAHVDAMEKYLKVMKACIPPTARPDFTIIVWRINGKILEIPI